jgi:hypothetical protein
MDREFSVVALLVSFASLALAVWLVLHPVQGPQGDRGIPGPQGVAGEVGPTGPQGPAGFNGKDGMSGRDGKDGLNGRDGLDADKLPPVKAKG